jgi:hypothetical protein
VSILRLGRIFVTNLTGNVVFTGFSHFPDPPPPPYATQSWPIPLVVPGTLHRHRTAAAAKRCLLASGEDRRTLARPEPPAC